MLNNEYKTIDRILAEQMQHPIFEIDETKEYTSEELAKLLYSQKLELAKNGKLVTSSVSEDNQEKIRCEEIIDYKINSIELNKVTVNEDDELEFQITYSVLPKGRKYLFIDIGSDWMSGNAILKENGWIERSTNVNFRKEDNGYRLVSEGF